MISWETFLYVFICGAMWMMSVVGLESAVVSPGLDRWNKRLFIGCFIVLVSFDTPYTRFRVPPLTLQPIVENAVKHGMDPDSGPLHILVRTGETASGSEVVVEDDGMGFDPAIADEPHTTLANIRQRVEMMCDGTLDIAPREGGGTVVRMTIPQQE